MTLGKKLNLTSVNLHFLIYMLGVVHTFNSDIMLEIEEVAEKQLAQCQRNAQAVDILISDPIFSSHNLHNPAIEIFFLFGFISTGYYRFAMKCF